MRSDYQESNEGRLWVALSHAEKCLSVQGMLGIFQKLVASRVHDQDGFRILEALLDSAPPETLQPYMPQVQPCAPLLHLGMTEDCFKREQGLLIDDTSSSHSLSIWARTIIFHRWGSCPAARFVRSTGCHRCDRLTYPQLTDADA